jgi:hypothetical protein
MTLEQLKRGNEIAREIQTCKNNIRKAQYTQYESVSIRSTKLEVMGLESSIEVPKTLFRTIGKLILSEYQQKLIELEDELKSL